MSIAFDMVVRVGGSTHAKHFAVKVLEPLIRGELKVEILFKRVFSFGFAAMSQPRVPITGIL